MRLSRHDVLIPGVSEISVFGLSLILSYSQLEARNNPTTRLAAPPVPNVLANVSSEDALLTFGRAYHQVEAE